jgi:hypothetical protein
VEPLTTSYSLTNSTEEYYGSTWTSGGNLIAARRGALGSAGTQTAL